MGLQVAEALHAGLGSAAEDAGRPALLVGLCSRACTTLLAAVHASNPAEALGAPL